MYIINEGTLFSDAKNIKKLKGNKIRMECILQTVGDINRNKRMYKKETLQESIDVIMPRIKERSFLSELDHPLDTNPSRQLTVSFKNASHLICELGWDGNKLVGILETLDTPSGQILKALSEDNIAVGYSYRGAGDLKPVYNEGYGKPTYFIVEGPLHSVAWDAVSFPSHAEAKLIRITETIATDIVNEVSTNFESNSNNRIITESNGLVCCLESGMCYLPNAFDKMIEISKKQKKSFSQLVTEHVNFIESRF